MLQSYDYMTFINIYSTNRVQISFIEKKNLRELVTSFCSKQWEHQKAPYILAPIEWRCFAREIANELDGEVISVVKYGKSISTLLQTMKLEKD